MSIKQFVNRVLYPRQFFEYKRIYGNPWTIHMYQKLFIEYYEKFGDLHL